MRSTVTTTGCRTIAAVRMNEENKGERHMDLNGYIADYNLSDQRYDNSESRAYNVGYNYYYESEDAELYDYARRVCSREAREFVSGYDCAAYDE